MVSDRLSLLGSNRNYLFWTSYAGLAVAVAVLGWLGGLIFGYAIDLPHVKELQKVRPNIVSYVYSEDHRVLGQFALEKRMLISYEQIPQVVKNSILAGEDANFFRHSGIDFRRVVVTAIKDILHRQRAGASTLTMQLSKLRFTSPEKTWERKIKDVLYALSIEKNFSKEQIFTLYCNQIYMGHGIYGISAAADFYFHKPLDQLRVTESAVLAGLIQRPGEYSPINHPQRALMRRDYVLRRMHQEGYIDQAVLKESLAEPLLAQGKNYEQGPAPYLVEKVRQHLEQSYPTETIWKGGLKIYTTLDYDVQVAARETLRKGLKDFDRAWKGSVENIFEQGKKLNRYFHPDWRQIFYEGQMIPGLVTQVEAKKAQVRLGSYSALIEPDDIEWTGEKRLDRVFIPGDVAVFSIQKIDRGEKVIEATLDQIPEVQGAMITIENKTGAIRAMVGGFDFRYSKFNRATQALRQPGSVFKPFTYVAAMEAGYSPFDFVLDSPVNFTDSLGRSYAPVNSDGEFKGLIRVREALAKSRNVPTIRLAHALGIEKVIEVALRFGLQHNFPPYLSVALGAVELTLEEITSAFTAFANNGLRAQPYFISRVEDYNGVILEEHQQDEVQEAISPEIAGKMLYLLQSVVEMGTAWRARELNRPVGGKTGTTNDSTDSWFVGFTPRITTGVWAGYDEKKSLGEKVYGATLALPIWVTFMKKILEGMPLEDFEKSSESSEYLARQTRVGEEKQLDAKDGILVEDITPRAHQIN